MSEILERPVLVLDKSYYPSHVTTVKEAVTSLCLDKARVLDNTWNHFTFEQWAEQDSSIGAIRSPNTSIPLPRVICINDWHNKKRETRASKYSRASVFKRDNWTCQYCNKVGTKKNMTIDHIIPKSRNGKNTFENTVTCCMKCNSIKGSKSLEELYRQNGKRLIREPVSPSLISFIKNSYSKEYEECWKYFI